MSKSVSVTFVPMPMWLGSVRVADPLSPARSRSMPSKRPRLRFNHALGG